MAVTPERSVGRTPAPAGPPFRGQFPAREDHFAAGSASPDMVVTRGDWRKVWTRPQQGRKGIVVTEVLITTCSRVGTGQKAASQAGIRLRLRNIFRRISSQRHAGLGTVWG